MITHEIDGLGTEDQTLRILDHEDVEIYSETRSGWSSEEIEPIMLQAVEDEVVAEFTSSGFNTRVLQLLRHAIFENFDTREGSA